MTADTVVVDVPGSLASRDPIRGARGPARIARAAVTTLAAVGEARIARAAATPAAQARALSSTVAELCAIHGVDVEVDGALPDWPCLMVANHLSYLDPLAILARAPALPLAGADVAAWPIVGTAATALGVHFVDRDRPLARARALRTALATLRAGVSVLNFPEGATTDGTRVLRFRRGGFGLAMLARVPVVPIAIRCSEPALAWADGRAFLPHYWRLSTRRLHARVHLQVCAALWPHADDAPDDLARRARHAITHALAERARG
ncbi:MAG: 1-acyl-sn-glycerol-3-phosphate acyltransferase [Myxococcales bacterium]|nr:1-acyl-sn-glycerol-3-phosphate acyltransferase [Myxococcales bacterium]